MEKNKTQTCGLCGMVFQIAPKPMFGEALVCGAKRKDKTQCGRPYWTADSQTHGAQVGMTPEQAWRWNTGQPTERK